MSLDTLYATRFPEADRDAKDAIWRVLCPHFFQRYVKETDVVLDIGAWIGVTPFWTAQIAKHVIAVEPDPKCLEILRALAPRYPNVTVVEAALATEVRQLWHIGPGSRQRGIDDGTGRDNG